MDSTELFSSQPLESSVIEQIRLGDWSPINVGGEARLCSQLLQSLCTIEDGRSAADPAVFCSEVKRWVDHCVAAAKNTSSYNSTETDTSSTIRTRIEAAFVETIWTLNIEWESDTADKSDGRWEEERKRHSDQSELLLKLTESLLSNGVITHDMAKERLDPEFLERVKTKFNLVSEQSEGFSKLITLIQATMAGVVPHQVSSGIIGYVESNPTASSDRGSVVIQALRSLPDLQKRVANLLLDITRLIGVFNIDPNRVLDIIIDCFMSSVRFHWAFYVALLDASPWCRTAAESLKVAQLVGWKLQFYVNGPASDHKYMDELSTVAALLITHRIIRLSDLYTMLSPNTPEDIEGEFGAWLAKQKEQRIGIGSGNSGDGSSSLLAKMGGLEDMGDGGENQDAEEAKGPEAASEWSNQHALLCAKLLSMGDTESALVYLQRFPNMARSHEQITDLVVRIVEASTSRIYQSTDCVRAPVKQFLKLKPVSNALASSTATVNAWGLPLHSDASGEEAQRADAAGQLGREHAPRFGAMANIAFLRLHRSPSLLTRLSRLCRYGLEHSTEDGREWIGVLRSWVLPAYSLCTPSAALSNELWLLVSQLPLAQRYELYEQWDAILSSGKPSLPQIASGGQQSQVTVQNGMTGGPMSMDMSLDEALDDGDDGGDDSDVPSGSCVAHAQPAYVEIEALYHETRRQVRSVMRRLSADNVKLMGRQLCNLCHSTPTLSLKIILDQVCSYGNLVRPVVEAFRYLTPFDSDVMFFTVLKIIGDPNSARVKDDGVNPAHWMQNLSSFVASFSRRHENARLDVVLDYVLKRTIDTVRNKRPAPASELVIVSEIVRVLAKIELMADANDGQVSALQGGHYLRLEAFDMGSPWEPSKTKTIDDVLVASSDYRLTRRMAQWLTSMLADRAQILPFVVSLCAHAEYVLKTVVLPLSSMLIIYDREIERIYQLFNLLLSNLKPEKYTRLIPGPHVLAGRYGLSWGLAMLWGRPSISAHLAQGLVQWEDSGANIRVEIVEQTFVKDQSSQQTWIDAEAPPTGAQSAETAATVAATATEEPGSRQDGSQMDVVGAEANAAGDLDPELPRVVSSLAFEAPLLPRDYVTYVARTLPHSSLDIGLSPEFVAMFWSLSLYDIEVPTGLKTMKDSTGRKDITVPVPRYDIEADIQKDLIDRVQSMSKESHSRSKSSALTQVSARANMAIDNLNKERDEHRQHVSRIRRWLIVQKDYWFCMAHDQRKQVAQALLQHCILPRAVLSASDASFCAKLLWMLHFPLATNKFSLMIVYDNIFSETLSTLLATFTLNEARNYAKFLNMSLKYLSQLHQSEAQYNERAKYWRYERGYLPPKSRTINQAMPASPTPGSGDSQRIKPGSTMLSYDDFRTVMRKWQVNLTKAFMVTLGAERSDTVRNGILALKEMQHTFPAISQYGRRILEKINEISENGRSANNKSAQAGGADDSDSSLKVIAMSYGSYLATAKTSWVSETEYYPVQARDTPLRSPRPANSQQTGKQKEGCSVIAGSGNNSGTKDGGPSSTSIELKAEDLPSERAKPSPGGRYRAAQWPLLSRIFIKTHTKFSPEYDDGVVHGARPANGGAARQVRGEGGARSDAASGDREQDAKSQRDRERSDASSRGRGRDRGRQRDNHQQESDTHSSSQRAADIDRRESRSVRSSPTRHDREDVRSETHKRPRDDSVVDVGYASQRGAISGSPNMSELHISSQSPASTQAAKLSNEEAECRRKELRAQLLKQQEEKQKSRSDRPPADSSTDRRDRLKGAGHWHARQKDNADSRESGGRRLNRRGPTRNAEAGSNSSSNHLAQAESRDIGSRRYSVQGQGQPQTQQQSDSGVFDRLGASSQGQQQQRKRQQHDQQSFQQPSQHQQQQQPSQSNRAEHSGRADRGQRRAVRSGGNSNSGRNLSPDSNRGGGGDRRPQSNAQSSISIRSLGGRQGKGDGDRDRDRGRPDGVATSLNRRGAAGSDQSASSNSGNTNTNANANGDGGGGRRGVKRGRVNDGRDWDDGKRNRR
ncbi:transcription factor/nuclear export subunit protein 2-domain-containing protein [Kickxella alabastrina]|uniref:transcription factor/nuclear export subunit protein 2-domain-containing protein n=1 Tax=Kickxella alabastrina TaxID=61397 RepID=UPI00221F2D7D|nr:transcription factor/nuclear export subunit protein 2-domain-containing protein [Kickxella alabastrina]KAI7834335.1 transcription factor/nuclear export subunit protein 2-domain-containing protein [Kickxella alabastrina]